MVFEIVAIVNPAQGKEARLEEVLNLLTAGVEEHEPDVESYMVYKVIDAEGVPEFVVIERFKEEATYEAHIKLEYFQALRKQIQEEALLAKPFKVMKVSPISGFRSRATGKAKLA